MSDFPWLTEVYDFVRQDNSHLAIDKLFDHVDDMLCAEDFESCDELLRTVDVSRLDNNLRMAFASITKAAATELPSRPQFLEKLKSTPRLT